MKYQMYMKLSNKLLPDSMATIIRSEIVYTRKEMLKKSFRVMNPIEIKMYDQNGDDFIKDLSTAVISFDAYKIPRIVKRLLL